MARHKLAILGGGLILALLVAAGSLYWASTRVPDFYTQAMAADPAPEVRRKAAKEFVQRTLRLVEDIEHSDRWAEEFDEEQVNSWLAEELHQRYPELVPPGVSDPRIKFTEDTVRLGFRYESDGWTGIVSLKVEPWVSEPNRLAIEITSIRAGLLPVPLEDVLQEVVRELEEEGWRVRWQQSDGNDVAVVDLSRGDEAGSVLEHVSVLDGRLRLSGKGPQGQETPADALHTRTARTPPPPPSDIGGG